MRRIQGRLLAFRQTLLAATHLFSTPQVTHHPAGPVSLLSAPPYHPVSAFAVPHCRLPSPLSAEFCPRPIKTMEGQAHWTGARSVTPGCVTSGKALWLSRHLTLPQDYISDSQSGVPGGRSLMVPSHGTGIKLLILVVMCLF